MPATAHCWQRLEAHKASINMAQVANKSDSRLGTHGLLAGFILIIGLLLAMAGIGIAYLASLNRTVTNIVDNHNERSRLASEMYIASRERALQLYAILQEPDPFDRDALVPQYYELTGVFRRAREKLFTLGLSQEEQQILKEQARNTALGAALQDQVLELALADKREQAEHLLGTEAMRKQSLVTAQLRRFLDRLVADGQSAAAAARKEYVLARTLMLVSAGLATLLASLIAVLVIRRQARLLAGLETNKQDLQRRVEERTEALSQAKQQLESDIEERKRAQVQLKQQYQELKGLHQQLQAAQSQLLQSEKLASIGQLAAGVAHEINNPIGFVQSNLGTLENYIHDLFQIITAYETYEDALPPDAAPHDDIVKLRQQLDLPYLKQDIPALLKESRDGITRVRKIVQDLKDFSRLDSTPDWQYANLHQGLDSTLNIVNNEIKYRADVIKKYGDIPEIECLPSQLNQVYMNLLINAAHAIEEPRGVITVRTGQEGDAVWIEIADTGKGIPEEIVGRIFDPFFTTKALGKGTGLGLSLAYGIVQKHNGRIEVTSEVGKGSTFRVTLPVVHQVTTNA